MLLDPITNQESIETERFTLRPVCIADRGAIRLHASDERVARMTRTIPHPLPTGATEAFLRNVTQQDREEHVWAIDSKMAQGKGLSGLISLKNLSHGQAELGYWIIPAFWNSGIASEAVEGLVAANPLNCTSIVARVFQDNPASARVATKAGFVLLGESETFSVARNVTVDTWDYVLRITSS